MASIQIYFEWANFFYLTEREGTKPEARRAESGGGVLGDRPVESHSGARENYPGALSPSPFCMS